MAMKKPEQNPSQKQEKTFKRSCAKNDIIKKPQRTNNTFQNLTTETQQKAMFMFWCLIKSPFGSEKLSPCHYKAAAPEESF